MSSTVCSTCFQPFNLMIRFECNHVVCLHCFQMLPNTTLPVKCGSCNKSTQNFRYKFQTVLSCDRCSQQKAVEEFWWCDSCRHTVCSLCAMQNHKNCDTSMWDDMRIWKYYVGETEMRLKNLVTKEKEKIDKFIEDLKEYLYEEVEKSANDTRELLEKEDQLVTQTFDITATKNKGAEQNSAPRFKNEAMNEALRLETKAHLKNLLDNLRFAGKKLNFDLELRRFIPPDLKIMEGRMQGISIDGIFAKASGSG